MGRLGQYIGLINSLNDQDFNCFCFCLAPHATTIHLVGKPQLDHEDLVEAFFQILKSIKENAVLNSRATGLVFNSTDYSFQSSSINTKASRAKSTAKTLIENAKCNNQVGDLLFEVDYLVTSEIDCSLSEVHIIENVTGGSSASDNLLSPRLKSLISLEEAKKDLKND